MRVIGGKFKGRRFGPKMDKWPTRPTTDYTKESIFNTINNIYFFEGKKVLDLFAGTGGISLEFLSRGVENITIVEDYPPCINYIKSLMKEFDCENQVFILPMDVMKFLKSNNQQFNLIFCDPPYSLKELADIPDLILDSGMLEKEGMLILEHSNLHDFSTHQYCSKVKKYGQTMVSFFEFS